ncbi:MAG: M28 family peptidase [Cryomorphaceae bacterium]|nr:MAG: M28 family peptidase [Cryomorphaceae bacterium]
MFLQRIALVFVTVMSGAVMYAQNSAPQIRNLKAEADTVSGEVVITYDLIDPDSREVEVFLRASNDYGQTWLVYTHSARGDIGRDVRPGKNKRIVWAYNRRAGNVLDFYVKVIADDGQNPGYENITGKVAEGRLQRDILTMQGPRHYLTGAPGLEIAQRLLTNRLHDLGMDVRRQKIMLGSYEGQNISGQLRGDVTETDVIMVAAHYDTDGESQGANDNASGVAVMLEAARILTEVKLRKSVVFVGFDLQKQGGIGSRRYLQKLSEYERKNIKAAYILDNVGRYSDVIFTQQFDPPQKRMFTALVPRLESEQWRGNFLFAISDENSIPARNTFATTAEVATPQFRVEALKVPAVGAEKVLFGSHMFLPFWEQEIPAVLLTDGAESRKTDYAVSEDIADKLDFERMGEVVRALVATIAEKAGYIHGDVQVSGISLKEQGMTRRPPDHLVDYHLYLTDDDEILKVRINHPEHGRLKLRLVDPSGEVFYQSRIDLYYNSVINIDISYLPKGVYLVNLVGSHFDEIKEFVLR